VLSWCDKLASVPTAGIALSPHFAVGKLVDSFTPILDPLVDSFRVPRFSFGEQQQGTGFSFSTEDGFVYGADATKLSVGFQHRMKVKLISGAAPVMEMLSNPLPYTKLLPVVSERLVEASQLLPEIANRKLFQAGIVATTSVAIEDVPPGVSRLIQYMGRPWGGELISYNYSIVSEITATDDWKDKCQHTVIKQEDPEKLLTLVFDFHRTFAAPQSSSRQSLKSIVSSCGESALEYFEDLAEGNRFDEHIISATS